MRLLLLTLLAVAGAVPPPGPEARAGEGRAADGTAAGAAAAAPQRPASPPYRPSAVDAPAAALRPTVGLPAADTILWRDLLAPRPRGFQPRPPGSPAAPVVRLGLQVRPLQAPGFADALPDAFARLPWIAPRALAPELGDPAAAAADPFTRQAVAMFVDAWARAGGRPVVADPFLPAEPEPPPPPARAAPAAPQEGEELPEFMSRYAELGVRMRGRADLGGDWTRFRPCTGQFQESCTPTLIPQLAPDVNLAVQIAGTVAERVHVDVDYDQLREFGAANRISILYQGNEDDILRSLEVGDVTFQLPRSRFLTQGIPTGNFGFQAQGQLGPVDFRGVWAEQKGGLSSREFRLTGVGNQRRFVQEDTLALDDADYARGQFFFLFDPRLITDHPHVDVLDLDAGAAPAQVVPGIEPIQLYRFENDPAARQQVQGFIQADAVAQADGVQVEESGWFRYLVPGQDYYVHPSGLWVALRNPLSRDEMLAVTYITATGDTVGTYNPERVYAAGGRPELRLLKASGANHQPGRPTWDLEMHQVYRVSVSPDVEPQSVEVTISLGEPSAGRTFKRAPDGRDVTFLQLFGLDQESPVDRVDLAALFAPARDFFDDQGGVQGTYVIFPTLRPFLEPPPNDLLGLTAEEARDLLADDANRRIYEAEDPYERDAGGRFRLTIPYRRRSEGVISSFSLGALGIVSGSERILLGDRALVRGVDYEIDYDVGQVVLLDPETLFAAAPDAPVRATWEQQQIFREAPTSVFGFNARVGGSDAGRLDLLALYRAEKTLINRPVLGLEPGAALLGGLNGRLARPVTWLDQLLGTVPGLRVNERSSFALEGELALSAPNPNTQGDVFLDDFDASDERPLSLFSYDWTRGSAPTYRDGADAELPPVLDETTLADFVWQHTWIVESVTGDSLGVHEGFLPREEIDRQIRVAGGRIRERGLRISFTAPQLDGRRWGSITTTLSPTGTDLTKSEFIEFYAAGGENLELVIDLGLVSEAAFFVDPAGRTAGVKPTGVPWGLGLLDQEADPARGEIWGNDLDLVGVWGEVCLAEPGRVYRLADRRANCTRGNGRNDTEDLDGDGNLDTIERSLRYVVELDGTSPFLARTTAETDSDFRLYRIPIRSVLAAEVNGPVTEGDLRAVRHLRITLTGAARDDLTLARMRIVGSRWIKRGAEGVLAGIVGDTAAMAGSVEVSPASRLTEGEAYASPPRVLEQLSDPTSAVGGQGVEFNEKSLSVRVSDVGAGERAELYSRFPQRPRDFLSYREARLWVLPRSGDWGADGPASFFFKIGTDPENFYLYRTSLPEPPAGAVIPSDWEPELVVDFGIFQELKRRAEETLALVLRGPGDPPLVIWAQDSTYAVVVSDQGRAPNLANVRELALGVWNRGDVPFDGEIWVNELRLSRGVREAGLAGIVHADLRAGDVVESRLTLSSRGAYFRQLEEAATYQDDRRLALDTRVRLERFAPAEWGVELPLSLNLDRSALDPTFLAESDVPAERLAGLRETGSSRTHVALGFRKTTPTANPVLAFALDGLETNVAWHRSRASSITSRVEGEGVDVRMGYDRRIEPRELDPVPGFMEPLIRWLLPGPLEDALLAARLRWSPERVGIGASYGRQDNRIFRYESILESEADSLVEPTLAPRELLETVADVQLQPFRALGAGVTFVSTRDLLSPAEAVADPGVQELLDAERRRIAGLDLGWETSRSIRTRIDYRPRVVSWLRHEVGLTTRYDGDRNPGFVRREAEGPELFTELERNASGEREVRALLALDPALLTREGWFPDEGAAGPVRAVLARLRPVSYTWTDGIFSRFNRDPVSPGAGYQLGWAAFDGYHVLEGDTAATLIDRVGHQVSWGVAGERASFDATYALSEIATLDTRADRSQRTETWPDLRARLDNLPAAGLFGRFLERITLAAGVRHSRRDIRYGQAEQRRRLVEDAYPFDVSLSWAGGLVTGYRAAIETGEGEDPTGDTERDRLTHRISISSAFLPPFSIGGEPARPVRLSLLGSYVSERECRVPSSRTECVAFVDQLDRALSLSLDSRVSSFELGVQASYTDRQSFVGQRRGSTQFQLSVYGQFVFEAGELPGVPFAR